MMVTAIAMVVLGIVLTIPVWVVTWGGDELSPLGYFVLGNATALMTVGVFLAVWAVW